MHVCDTLVRLTAVVTAPCLCRTARGASPTGGLPRAICRQIFKIFERFDRNRLGNVEELAQAA
ncbi:hypothetical protein ACGFNV_35245 [Streptomyces sp. NPDC048751]|uniref:hypothetical protein n=1 Tax=Streptomyces sp. NPDC048751 TaxID=3365591 RepID=UPI00370FB4C3